MLPFSAVLASTLDAYWDTNGNDYAHIDNTTQSPFQTFTATANETLDRIDLYTWRRGVTGTITVYLTNVDTGIPIAPALASTQVNATTAVTEDADGGFQTGEYWIPVDFGGYALVTGTTYGIVVTCNFSDGQADTNAVKFGRANAGGYGGGTSGMMNWNTGVGTAYAYDYYFRTYVTAGYVNNVNITQTSIYQYNETTANATYTITGLTDNATYRGLMFDSVTHNTDNAYYWTTNVSGDFGNDTRYEILPLYSATMYYKIYYYVSDTEIYYSPEYQYTEQWIPELIQYPATLSGVTLLVGGQITDKNSSANITRIVWQYGIATGNYSSGYNQLVNLDDDDVITTFFAPVVISPTYYVRIAAWNGYYWGYSDEQIATGNTTFDESYLTLTATISESGGNYDANGNIAVTITGSIENNSGFVVEDLALTWGISADGTGFSYVPSNLFGTFYSYGLYLSGNTTYYAKFGAYLAGSWHYSDIVNLTTSAQGLVISWDNPVINTLVASNITGSSFTAHGNLVSLGGDETYSLGFQIDGTNQAGFTQILTFVTTGNFSVGAYSQNFSQFPEQTLKYRAYVVTTHSKVGVGQWVNVTLSLTSAQPPPTSSSGIPGITGDFQTKLREIMASYGMDNLLGHWAFMILVMAVLAIFLGAFIMGNQDDLAKKVLWLVLGILELAVFAGFVFSGLLGIWAVAILVIVAVGLIIILGGKLLNQGRLDA